MQIPFTAATLSSWVSFGLCRVREIHGYNNQASDLYIQLHEASQASAATVIANGAVPKFKSLLCQQANGFKWEFDEGIDFNELVFAVSTTEPNLTLVGAAGGLDCTLVVGGLNLVVDFPNIAVAGDLTTNLTGNTALQVWAEAAGPQKILRLDSVEKSGAVNSLKGWAQDAGAAATGAKTQFIVPLAANATVKLSCGTSGFSPMDKTTTQLLKQGLTISAAANAAIRAIYTT